MPRAKSSKGKSWKKSNSRRRQDTKGPVQETKSEEADKVVQTGTTNDVSWYDKYPDLLSSAANVPFATVPGMKVQTGYLIDTREGQQQFEGTQYEYEPGVLAITWYPYTGKATDNNDPVAIAAREIYAKVRSSYSGGLNADAPDFLIYMQSLDSIFSYIGSLKRIYRTLNTYSPMNKATPDMLVGAMGYDDPEIIAALQRDKDRFFGQINQLIYMTDKFVCPAIFPVFNRHYWLNDNVFGDEPTPKAQMYVFTQAGYYQFSTENTPDDIPAGGLKMVSYPTITADDPAGQLYDFGARLISALAGADTTYDINGYLTRAYADVPRFTVEKLDASAMLNIAYDETVLSQIENVVVAPDTFVSALETSTVSQDPKTNALLTITGYSFSAGGRLNWIKPLVNLHTDSPTYQQVVEATRMMSIAKDPVKTGNTWHVEMIASTEIVSGMFLFTWDPTTDQAISYTISQTNTAYGTAKDWMKWASQLSHFRYHPRIQIIAGDMNGWSMTLWEEWNLSAISVEQFKRINEVCTYSLYNSFNQR